MRIITLIVVPLFAVILAGCGPKKEKPPPPAGKAFTAEVEVVDILEPGRIECARLLPEGGPMTVRATGNFPESMKRSDFIELRGTMTNCQQIKEVLFIDLVDAEVVRTIRR
jgi:hypothetical protein